MLKRLIMVLLLSCGLLLSACGGQVTVTKTDDNDDLPVDEESGTNEEHEIAASDIARLTSLELVNSMGAGWNLGNTLDAHWNARPYSEITVPEQQETLWGNPVTTKEMIDFVKASGYTTVRVPVTWYIFTGASPDYIINEIWMDRVQEVVDYVIDNGIFCIVNIHHDDYKYGGNWENGWLTLYNAEDMTPLTDEEKEAMSHRYARIWEQIAERFKDYDEYLLFEGINEPRTENLNANKEQWAEQSQFLNNLNQTFIETVRASGGRNNDRHLMITPYYASVGMDANDNDGRISGFVNPGTGKLYVTDTREGDERLIVSLHYYEPWGFVTAPSDSQWFSAYFDMNVGSVSWNIGVVTQIIRDNFTANGIPVIMGETGALARDLPDGEGSNETERVKWAETYVAALKEFGVPSIIWDDGGQFRLLDRHNLEWFYPELNAAFVRASSAK